MTMTLYYHLGGLFHRLPLLDVLHDQLVKHPLLDVLHDHLVTHPLLDVLHDHLVEHLLLPIQDVLHELQVEKAKKSARKKNWGWQLSSWQMFFLGGGKCPNLGVVNVRILGVVNVLLANDSQSNLDSGPNLPRSRPPATH